MTERNYHTEDELVTMFRVVNLFITMVSHNNLVKLIKNNKNLSTKLQLTLDSITHTMDLHNKTIFASVAQFLDYLRSNFEEAIKETDPKIYEQYSKNCKNLLRSQLYHFVYEGYKKLSNMSKEDIDTTKPNFDINLNYTIH